MRDERDPFIIKDLISKGHDRIDVILHYGIAAPKLHHVNEVPVDIEVDDDGLEAGIADAMSTEMETAMDLDHLKRRN